MDKINWLIYRAEDTQLIWTEHNDKEIKEILIEKFQPFTVINIHDYLTGKLIESLRLDVLYEIKDKQ